MNRLRNRIGMLALAVGASAALLAAGCAAKTVAPPTPQPPPGPVQTVSVISGPAEGFALAMDAYKGGDPEKARLIAMQVTDQFPNTLWQKRSLFLLGRTLIALDQTAEAETVMLRVPSEYPELGDYALYFLAEYLSTKARPADAVRLYQRLLDQYPRSFWTIRAEFRKAQALAALGAFPQAAEAYGTFLQQNPHADFAAEAGLGLANALVMTGEPDKAVRAYLDVSVRYPGAATDGDVEKGLDYLKQCGIEIPPLTADELYERGRKLFKTGQYDKAYDAFTRALDAAPDHPRKNDMVLRAGISLLHRGKRTEAAAVLEQVARTKPAEQHGAEALNWLGKAYSRLGRKDEAIDSYLRLVATYPESEWADDALFLIGNIYRESNEMNKALKFYDRLAETYPESKYADSAFWWKAWAYYSAGDYQKADRTLQELVNRYPASFLVNQAWYWQGRAAEQRRDLGRAVLFYRKVVKRAPYTYYGYRAADRLTDLKPPPAAELEEAAFSPQAGDGIGMDAPSVPELDEQDDSDGPPVWTEETLQALAAEPTFKKTLELMHLSMKKEAAAELWTLQAKVPRRRGATLGLSKAFFELGDYHRSLILVLRNYERYLEGSRTQTADDFWLLAYPQGYWDSILAYSRKYGQDPYFVAAIIREESQFNTEALSPAGARGLMQVMPSTAEWVAQNARVKGFDRTKLFDPDLSINIGTWYIGHLMKRFRGDPLLVAAGYNAGPEAVTGWIERNGNGGDRDIFVESIPFSETRGYVKKVLRNYAEYKRIYGKGGPSAVLAPFFSGADLSSLIDRSVAPGP